MKLGNTLKISALCGLLLIIFSLPTLTASQLVGVLGTKSEHISLIFKPLSDSSTYTSFQDNTFNVSFQLPRVHTFATVLNPSDHKKTFTLHVLNPKSFSLGTKATFSGKPININPPTYPLATTNSARYNSSVDLSVGPHTSVPLAIDTTHSESDHGTLILSVSED